MGRDVALTLGHKGFSCEGHPTRLYHLASSVALRLPVFPTFDANSDQGSYMNEPVPRNLDRCLSAFVDCRFIMAQRLQDEACCRSISSLHGALDVEHRLRSSERN